MQRLWKWIWIGRASIENPTSDIRVYYDRVVLSQTVELSLSTRHPPFLLFVASATPLDLWKGFLMPKMCRQGLLLGIEHRFRHITPGFSIRMRDYYYMLRHDCFIMRVSYVSQDYRRLVGPSQAVDWVEDGGLWMPREIYLCRVSQGEILKIQIACILANHSRNYFWNRFCIYRWDRPSVSTKDSNPHYRFRKRQI